MMPALCITCDAPTKNKLIFSIASTLYKAMINHQFILCNHRCDMCGNPSQSKSGNYSLKNRNYQRITGREYLNLKSSH